jgi:hypothetical protein
MTSWRRIWIIYYKSEKDLDHLLQVEGGLASIYRRAPIPPDYLDFINDALPYQTATGARWGLHLGRAGPVIGRARVLQATRLSPPFGASILVGRARTLEGHEYSKLPAQPTFLCLQLGWAGPGVGRAQVLQTTQLSPPLCIFN